MDKGEYLKLIEIIRPPEDEYIEIIKDLNEISLMIGQDTWHLIADKFDVKGLL